MLVLHVLTSLICPFLTLCGGIFAGTCVTLDVPQLPVHVMRWALLFSFWWSGQDSHCCRSYVRHINTTSSDCLLPIFDAWHRCPCDWLHAHLAQLSDPRSSRRDSAHAVYWVRLHPHCFLHPLHFGAATLMWVKVMWLSIVEYLTVDMSLGDIQTTPHLLSFDPWITRLKLSDGGIRLQEEMA